MLFNKKSIILWVYLTILFVIGMLREGSSAVMILSFGWLLVGLLIIKISFPSKNQPNSKKLWLLFFSIYYTFMLIANFIYVSDPSKDFFFHVDSLDFYNNIQNLVNRSKSLNEFDKVIWEGKYWPAFAVISWLSALFANLLGESNSITLQKTQIIFYCAMTIVFLYNLARIYFTPARALKVAITFGLLTHILTFSGSFQRDIPIMMAYTMGFYILSSKWSLRNLFVLILLGFLTMEFRFQHGISFILLIAIYVFMRARKMKDKLAYGVILIFLACSGIAFVFLTIESYKKETVEKLERYQEYHEEGFSDAGGLTSLMSKLPVALQPLGNAAISQTYPMPINRAIDVKADKNGVQWLKTPLIVSQIVWVLVWVIILYGIINKKYRKTMPDALFYSFIASIILILAISSGSYEYRRMLCAYPPLYLTAAFFLFKKDIKSQKIFLFRILMVYGLLSLIYIFLKA